MDISGGGVISSGSLRTKISLKGGYSQSSLVCPFHLMKPELPQQSVLLGSQDLLGEYDMSVAYHRFCGSRKMREDLSSFLPHLVGDFNFDSTLDFSSLKNLVEKPPITGKEITGLLSGAMSGFRLVPGSVPEPYRFFDKRVDVLDENAATLDENDNDNKLVKRFARCLDDLDDIYGERKYKKHKGDDSYKKQKKKKKDKKRKRDCKMDDEPSKRSKKF